MRSVRFVAAALLVSTACARGAVPTDASDPSESPVVANPPLATVQLVFPPDRTVTAEVADDHDERLLGLMNRRTLEDDAGMLFLFPAKSSGGFWMKNTLIALQIAYLGRTDDGFEVLALLEMVPCKRDPCPSYPPGVAYDAALEMTTGWFDAAGVQVGDVAIAPDGL